MINVGLIGYGRYGKKYYDCLLQDQKSLTSNINPDFIS